MHKIMILVIFLVGIVSSSIGFAIDTQIPPTGSTTNIGILDIDYVMEKTGAAKRATDRIYKKYAFQRKLLEKEERDLQNDVKKYNKISAKLSPVEIKRWERRINNQQAKLQQKQAELQEKVLADQELETQKIISHFFGTVVKIAEKYQLDIVVFKDVTAFNGAKIHDITNELVKAASATKKKKH